ncbi:MAG: hypothetical protein KF773_42200 [Deltaproteobacteria bacterium]|nr:hypothetical protein [Deltaproteobacteria bacterium]
MRNTLLLITFAAFAGLAACTATEKNLQEDFAFDGTCTNCHAGLSSGHVHKNYKLRCIDCHGGNDQASVPTDAFAREADFRNPNLLKEAHVRPRQELARFFYANGIDDDGDGVVDEAPVFEKARQQNATAIDRTGNAVDLGEIFEPGLHGEGPGEFFDTELSRDLNYTRFLNPGDLRVATISCGGGSRAAIDGGGGGACHQQTIDIVRRSIMVNQAAVTNGAYYGNENWRGDFVTQRDKNGKATDPRFGAFGYALDYDGPDGCIDKDAALADFNARGPGGRVQPTFDTKCLQDRATSEDRDGVGPNAQGNALLPAFEIAQGTIRFDTGNDRGDPAGNPSDPGSTLALTGAGDLRLPWGGKQSTSDAHVELAPLLNGEVLPGIPDPVDVILRTFRAYYPLNYPGSTTNFNFTFGTSILPEVARFRTANPYGRGHSSGCSACHAAYNYEGNREPTRIRQDDGTFVDVTDPTTKHREFDPKTDRGTIDGKDRLIGRIVSAAEQDAGRNGQKQGQQKTYSAKHQLSTKVDTDTCGLCHVFVTRINQAYQGMAEEEQRDQLSRRASTTFVTPNKTTVEIHDSWVREDFDVNNDGVFDANGPTVIAPVEGLKIIELAKKRDAELAAKGFLPGSGGCAPNVFTEDCNNNGELDKNLVLTRLDENGNVVATVTINEDLDGDNKLDLIDRVPREKAIDGRQMRYVYGGRNGSTRQMDVHFERGMHCIDCHFIQDLHGDGHVYSTNWDNIEIECEDCHGTKTTRATLVTSGPNGGNDLTLAKNEDLLPFFERRNGQIIQRSRVRNDLFWVVPQTADASSPSAIEAHGEQHVAEQRAGSEFAGGVQGQGKMTSAKIECAACHNGWVVNCVGCHVEVNIGDKQRDKLLPGASNTIVKDAGENEVWLSNRTNPGHINFQLLGLLRSPIVLGSSSLTEQGRLGTFRSSMQALASVSDQNGDLLRDNLTFTTFQTKDANSGRQNVATSGVAMNQTMPHTVRPAEAHGCETCHALMNEQGQVRNEHLMAQTMGVGTGSLPYVGDWVFAAGTNGLELFEYKQEKELGASKANPLSTSHRFPGLIVDQGNALTRVAGKVEPNQAGAIGNDVLLIRNFNVEPPVNGTRPPSLRDFAVLALTGGVVQFIDVSERGHPSATRPAVNNTQRVTNVSVPGALNVNALAHIGSDVSDPFVYAGTEDGVTALKITNARDTTDPGGLNAVVQVGGQLALPGKVVNALAYGGDRLYAGTVQGTIEVIDLSNPNNPALLRSIALPGAPVVNGMHLSGFVLYLATTAGTAAVSLDNPDQPGAVVGLNAIQFIGPPSQGVYAFQGTVFAATGAQGVQAIDYRTVAAPMPLGPITSGVNAVDVIVSRMPGQVWVIALDSNGSVNYSKLNNSQTPKEICFTPTGRSPAAGCTLDLEFRDAPAQSGRDPSFNPATGQFDPVNVDPSSPVGGTFTQNTTILGGGKRLARPVLWEQLNTLTGRRYRDSFMPGSGTISLEVMQRMRSVQVCETNEPSNDPAGLNQLGYFLGPGDCQPFGANLKPKRVCSVETFGGPEVCKLEPVRVDPTTLPKHLAAPPASQYVPPNKLVPVPAPGAPWVSAPPVTTAPPPASSVPPAAIPTTAAPAAAAAAGVSAR